MWTVTGYQGVGFDPSGMWRVNLVTVVMMAFTLPEPYGFKKVCILNTVTSQCSEAHRQTCYWPYLQLQELSEQSSPTYRYIPDYNTTTLTTVCRYYNEYRNCSLPFLSSCDEDTVIELQSYDVTLGFICTDESIFNDYLRHKTCFNRLQIPHTSCKQKGLASMSDIDVTSSAYKYIMCGSARDYVLCIYTATALGCSLQAAEVYFKLLNHSIGSIFTYQHYDCKIPHPMDVISIYTTPPPSTTTVISTSTTGENNRGDNQEPFKETSGCSRTMNVGVMNVLGCIFFHIIVCVNMYDYIFYLNELLR